MPTLSDSNSQLQQGLAFLSAIDALKSTYRKCLIMNGERNESTAEHSFSLAMSVLLFGDLANEKIDKIKTLKMALYHDLGEALLGDVFHYDKDKVSTEQLSESEAIKKILAPIRDSALATEVFELWNEFENGSSPEAVFLRGLDRFLPMFHNYKTQGHSWVKFKVTKEMALTKNAHIEKSSAAIWDYTKKMLDESQSKAWIS